MVVQHVSGRRRIQARAYRFDLWLAALVLLAAAYILVAATVSIGVFGFRNYFEPLAFFFLARLMPFSRRDMTRLLLLLAGVAAVVALFGIYQARFIDFPTMVSMGYLDEFGNLPFAFKTALQDGVPRPRAISTVTGPNQLAIYLNIFILLTGYALVWLRNGAFRSLARQAMLVVLLAIYVLCLLLTYSRGGLLALGVSLLGTGVIVVYERGIKRTWHELIHNRWLWLAMIAAAAVAVGGLLATGFARRIWRGLTGQDPAALGHLTSLSDALGYVTYNPWGMGMGMAGPRALRFWAGRPDPAHREHLLPVRHGTGVARHGAVVSRVALAGGDAVADAPATASGRRRGRLVAGRGGAGDVAGRAGGLCSDAADAELPGGGVSVADRRAGISSGRVPGDSEQ